MLFTLFEIAAIVAGAYLSYEFADHFWWITQRSVALVGILVVLSHATYFAVALHMRPPATDYSLGFLIAVILLIPNGKKG